MFIDKGMTCLQSYGTADAGLIAYETSAREGLVIDEGVIVEIVRPGSGARTALIVHSRYVGERARAAGFDGPIALERVDGTDPAAKMAPELIDGPGDVNEATDQYGLGVVLYEAIAGRLPSAAPAW